MERTLNISSVGFAVMWTALMWRWSASFETVPVVLLVFCGALAGLLWHWLYGKCFRWFFAPR